MYVISIYGGYTLSFLTREFYQASEMMPYLWAKKKTQTPRLQA
jgi:hypothetical protein